MIDAVSQVDAKTFRCESVHEIVRFGVEDDPSSVRGYSRCAAVKGGIRARCSIRPRNKLGGSSEGVADKDVHTVVRVFRVEVRGVGRERDVTTVRGDGSGARFDRFISDFAGRIRGHQYRLNNADGIVVYVLSTAGAVQKGEEGKEGDVSENPASPRTLVYSSKS